MAGYPMELADTREMLDKRYDDIANGAVRPVDGERSFSRLRAKGRDRRSTRT